MSPAVNEHVLSGWCQQNSSVYEIIFSLNERLNELLSPVDPVPAPVFNISWAIFLPPSGVERLSHTLSGTWKCLCFSGVCWQRRGDKAKFVCDCSARLHRCGWLITLKSPALGGGASPSESQRTWGVLLTAVSEEGEVFFSLCESKTASQVLLDQVFAPAISSWGTENRKWKEMQDIESVWIWESSRLLSARRMFIYLQNWLTGCFHNKTK